MSLGHVLIIRPGALGDAVLTLPALAALHTAGAESLTILGTPASWAFLRRDGTSPRVEDFGSSEWLGLFADGARLSDRAIEILKRTQTAILYLTGETSPVERRLTEFGVERIFAFAPPLASVRTDATLGPMHFEMKWNNAPPCHAARQLLDPLVHLLPREAFSGALDPARIERLAWLTPTVDELIKARSEAPFGGRNQVFFALHPGSGGRKKCWPALRFAELAVRIAEEFRLIPVIFFGPADDDTRREFAAAMPARIDWHERTQQSLREAVAVLKSCLLFIGNDSGLSHLASRAVPVLSTFGPTKPNVWYPIGRNVHVVLAAGSALNTLSVDDVFSAVPALILQT